MTVALQRHDATLSGDQAGALVNQLIQACETELSAQLLQQLEQNYQLPVNQSTNDGFE